MSATGEGRRAHRLARLRIDLPSGPEAGATLLEMLVVVGLMAMIGTMAMASFRPALRRASLAAEGSGLALSLARTRAAALRSDQAATLAVSADGSSYTAAGRTVALAPGVRLTADPEVLTFFPDGTSSGSALRLQAGRRRLDLTVKADEGPAKESG